MGQMQVCVCVCARLCAPACGPPKGAVWLAGDMQEPGASHRAYEHRAADGKGRLLCGTCSRRSVMEYSRI